VKFLIIYFLLVFSSCSTTSVSELQFETGETLGTGHFRGSIEMESTRLVPFFSDPLSSVVQSIGIFQGGTGGVRGEIGVIQELDIGVGAFITTSGGGWKIQGKYQWMGGGSPLAGAFVFGYGITSGSGGVSYLGASIEDQQYLTIKTLSFGIPFSRRISPTVVIYFGPLLNDSAVNGLDNGLPVSTSIMDLGINLGAQIKAGIFEGKLEMALMKLSDPFSGGSRMVPYAGLSLGVWY